MIDKKHKFNLIEFSLKHQRLVFLCALLLSAVNIFYALIYCTNLAPLRMFDEPEEIGMYVKGAELFNEVQPFNRALLLFGFIQLGIVAICYIFFCQKRRIYYIGNYVSGIGFAGFSTITALYSLIFNIIYMGKYAKIDFATYKSMAELYKLDYIRSSFLFILGILLAFVSIAVSLFVSLVVYGKFNQSKEEYKKANLKN